MPTQEQVLEVLKDVYDPEIPFNIVDLGLVYGVEIDEGNVDVKMTLTFPGCGMGPYMANNARERIMELDDVEDVNVEMVFDPPWSPDLVSDEIKAEMGID
jgi:metal-sulfur cluster biosynthetic enzyme